MATTVYFATISKRRNSTLQPTVSNSYSCILKEATSLDHPVFILEDSGTFSYNYCKWDNRYYFVDDVASVRNNIWEVSCTMDVLATYRAEILASTQYVAYSSLSGGTFLADTRIPLLKSASVSQASSTMNFLFNTTGFYVVSAIGKNGCNTWMLDSSNMADLLDKINDWSDDLIDSVDAGNYPWSNPVTPFWTWDWTSQPEQSAAKFNLLSIMVGNAYASAPECIRSCIWVPFFTSWFTDGTDDIYLGQFKTGVNAFKCKTAPETRTVTVNIPWQHTDWRRAVCEEVYLYLPLVGMVSIPSDEIINETSLNITWSATATDGKICYIVETGNQVIGTYGADAAVNYPIGVSQQASLGEVLQTGFQGLQKTVSGAISGDKTQRIANTLFNTIDTGYQVANTALTRYNTCIGGIGGGAGIGLPLDAICFTVSHDTVVAPNDMKDTMGLPTMKPVLLSTLSGYCECANAHVQAPATAQELEAIDSFLNGGFFIE